MSSPAANDDTFLHSACSAMGLTPAEDTTAVEQVMSVIRGSEKKVGDSDGDAADKQHVGEEYDILVAVVLVRLVRIAKSSQTGSKTGSKTSNHEVPGPSSQQRGAVDSEHGAQSAGLHRAPGKARLGMRNDGKAPSGSADILHTGEEAPNLLEGQGGTSTQDNSKVGGNRPNVENSGTHGESHRNIRESFLIPQLCWILAKFLSSFNHRDFYAADIVVAAVHAIKKGNDAQSLVLSKLCEVVAAAKDAQFSGSTVEHEGNNGNLKVLHDWIATNLLMLLEGAIELCEMHADFEFIWERCLRDAGKLAETAFAVSSDSPKRNTSPRELAKESAWLLLAFSVTRAPAVQDEGKDACKRTEDHDVPQFLMLPKVLAKRHKQRHKGSTTAGACISLLLESSFHSHLHGKRQRDEDNGSKERSVDEEPVKKKGRGEDDVGPAQESSSTSASGVRYGRHSIEAEAIAALKMMVSGGVPSAPMAADRYDVTTSTTNILNELRDAVGLAEDTLKRIAIDDLRLEMERVADVATTLCSPTTDSQKPVSKEFTTFPVPAVLSRGLNDGADEKALNKRLSPSSSKLMAFLSTDEARMVNNAVMRENFHTLHGQALRTIQKALSERLKDPVSVAPSFDADVAPLTVYMRFASNDRSELEGLRARLVRCKEEGQRRSMVLRDDKGCDVVLSSFVTTGSEATPMDTDDNETRQPRWSAFSEAPQAFKMELNEWTGALIACVNAVAVIKPSPRLLSHIESCGSGVPSNRKRAMSAVIIPLLNQILKRLDAAASSQPFPLPNNPYDDADMLSMETPVEAPSVGSDGGLESRKNNAGAVSGEDSITSDEFRRALVFLYYHALEGILRFETSRTKSVSHQKLVFNGGFHRAILSLCHVCLLRGIGSAPFGEPVSKSDPPSILALMSSSPQDFVKVSETFMRGLGQHANVPSSPVRFGGMPAELRRHIREVEETILESTLWESNASSSSQSASRSVRKTIDELQRLGIDSSGERYWPPEILRPGPDEESGCENVDDDKFGRNGYGPSQVEGSVRRNPDYAFVTYILRRLLPIVSHRVSILCAELGIPAHFPLANQIWYALRFLFRNHVDLMYDRHVDQLVLCAVYGVGKIMKYEPELSFARIIEVYTRLNKGRVGEKACQRIIRHVKTNTEYEETINNPGQVRKTKKKKKFGNIIHLYNQIFVPAVKQHLLYSSSLKEGTNELKRCMAEQAAMESIQTADDAVVMADRVARDGIPMPSLGQCEQLQKVDHRSGIRVRDSNLFLSVPANSMVRTSTPKREAASLTLRTRALYEFGRSLHSDLNLINKTALCEEKA